MSISILKEPILTQTPPKLCSREEGKYPFDKKKSLDYEVQESDMKIKPCPFCPENCETMGPANVEIAKIVKLYPYKKGWIYT